jgi:phenylalanyl-tRNA synthetase beta subunit
MLVAKIGKEVPEKEVLDILTRLGFEVTSKK